MGPNGHLLQCPCAPSHMFQKRLCGAYFPLVGMSLIDGREFLIDACGLRILYTPMRTPQCYLIESFSPRTSPHFSAVTEWSQWPV